MGIHLGARREFSFGLLEKKKVACVPGTAFGPSGEGFVRCCYATSLDQIKVAIKNNGDGISPQKPGGQLIPSGIEKKIAGVSGIYRCIGLDNAGDFEPGLCRQATIESADDTRRQVAGSVRRTNLPCNAR